MYFLHKYQAGGNISSISILNIHLWRSWVCIVLWADDDTKYSQHGFSFGLEAQTILILKLLFFLFSLKALGFW